MLNYTKFIGDTAIPLELLIIEPSGMPYIGASPFIQIRRQSDNYYLDFHDGAFKNSGWTSKTQLLIEINSGAYQYIWDSHLIITTAGNYVVEYYPNIINYRPDMDYLTFTSSDAESIATAVGELIVEGSINPVDLRTAIKEIHVYATGNISRDSVSGANTYKDSDGNDVFVLIPNLTERNRS